MQWWQSEQFWMVITGVVTVGLSALMARRQTRAEFARQMRVRIRDEAYQPLLAGLNRFQRQLSVTPFPVVFYFSEPPNHAALGHFDLSWWGQLRDRGGHLRLDGELIRSLHRLELMCEAYIGTREQAIKDVDIAVGNAFEMANITGRVAGLGPEIIDQSDFMLTESLFRDGTDPQHAKGIVLHATERIPSVERTRDDAAAIAEMVDHLIDNLESRISSVESEWR